MRVRGQLGHPHAEARLVHVGAHQVARLGQQRLELGHRVAQAGAVLRRHEDGDAQRLGGAEELARREDAVFFIFIFFSISCQLVGSFSSSFSLTGCLIAKMV